MKFSIFDSDIPYEKHNNYKVTCLIKVINRLEKTNPNSKKISKLKLQIFKMMKLIIEKNINNYNKYTRNSPVLDEVPSSEEMEAEAFIVLDKCISGFNYKYDFYFYFNKSLARNFYKIFDKEKRAYERAKSYKVERSYDKKHHEPFGVFFGIDFLKLGLNEHDVLVLKSKINEETKDMFQKNNPDFPISKYFSSFKKIKQILIKLREDGEL